MCVSIVYVFLLLEEKSQLKMTLVDTQVNIKAVCAGACIVMHLFVSASVVLCLLHVFFILVSLMPAF